MLPLVTGTPRLSLRAMLPADGGLVQASRMHPDNIRYQGWRPKTVAQVVEHARRQDPSTIGRAPGTIQLVFEEDGQFVGDFGVTTRRPMATVEVGITIAAAHHRRGLATRGTRLLLGGLFGLGVHRVVAQVDPRNEPSLRLFQRLGFRREGHLVSSYYDELYEEWCDEICFALLRTEWPTSRA